jgi:hypothetical protein
VKRWSGEERESGGQSGRVTGVDRRRSLLSELDVRGGFHRTVVVNAWIESEKGGVG